MPTHRQRIRRQHPRHRDLVLARDVGDPVPGAAAPHHHQYPDRIELPVQDILPARYRGFLEVDVDICTGCQACERACPISCIQIELEKDATNPKQRVVTPVRHRRGQVHVLRPVRRALPDRLHPAHARVRGHPALGPQPGLPLGRPLKPFPVYKVDKGAPYIPRAPLGSLVRALVAQRRWDAPALTYLPPEPLKAPPPPPPKPAPAAKPAAPAAPSLPLLRLPLLPPAAPALPQHVACRCACAAPALPPPPPAPAAAPAPKPDEPKP